MKKKVLAVKTYIFILAIFLTGTLPLLAQSNDDKGFDLSVPLNEGIAAEKAGDYDKAIESYRKVLFVDGSDVATQFKLAEVLLKKGDNTRAYKEFRYFLKNIHDSKRVSEEEKQRMVKRAEEVVAQVKDKRKGLDLLTFFDVNILIITFVLTAAFLIRLSKYFLPSLDKEAKDEKALKEIYVERYWERESEREMTGIPFSVFTIIMFGLLVIFYILTFRIFQNIF